jgi:hypothetical protein
MKTWLRVWIVTGAAIIVVLLIAIIRMAVIIPRAKWKDWRTSDWWLENIKAAAVVVAKWKWTEKSKIQSWWQVKS